MFDVAEGGLDQRLVERVPVVGFAAELPAEVGGVLAELVDGGRSRASRRARAAADRRSGRPRRARRGWRSGRAARSAGSSGAGSRTGSARASRRLSRSAVVAHRPLVGTPIEALEVALADLGADVDVLGRAREDARPLDREAEGVVVEAIGGELQVGAEAPARSLAPARAGRRSRSRRRCSPRRGSTRTSRSSGRRRGPCRPRTESRRWRSPRGSRDRSRGPPPHPARRTRPPRARRAPRRRSSAAVVRSSGARSCREPSGAGAGSTGGPMAGTLNHLIAAFLRYWSNAQAPRRCR